MDHFLINIKSYLNNTTTNNKSNYKSNKEKKNHDKNTKHRCDDEFGQTYEEVANIAQHLQAKTLIKPVIGIVCGSGLGGLANLISDSQTIEYQDIPKFPVSTVAGHAGALVFGHLEKVPVVCMKGRIHAYEGYSLATCTLPIRVMKLLGVQVIIITNAAGGLNDKFNVADIMLIRDHIFFPGLSGNNPLRGLNDTRFGPRFPPMTECYNSQLRKIVDDVASKVDIKQYMHQGVYGMCGGPNFETVAEAKFLRGCGVDAVGMSTVHEVIVAHHCGMRVLAFSLITNMVVQDYDSKEEASHDDVLLAAKRRSKDFEKLIQETVVQIQKTIIHQD